MNLGTVYIAEDAEFPTVVRICAMANPPTNQHIPSTCRQVYYRIKTDRYRVYDLQAEICQLLSKYSFESRDSLFQLSPDDVGDMIDNSQIIF